LASTSVMVYPFQGSEGNSNHVRGIYRNSPFPHHPKCTDLLSTLRGSN
jgi:hypothetical protein